MQETLIILADRQNHLPGVGGRTDPPNGGTLFARANAGRKAMLELPMTTIFLSAMLLAAAPSRMETAQLAAVVQDPWEYQVSLPDAAVFFLPKSSALSPLAQDVVAQAARQADAGTIVIIRASYDHEAGETAQTALLRGDAVRDELIDEGVSNSAIRTLISGTTGAGIEARRVVVSVMSQNWTKSTADGDSMEAEGANRHRRHQS
jgi:hypothetical protein